MTREARPSLIGFERLDFARPTRSRAEINIGSEPRRVAPGYSFARLQRFESSPAGELSKSFRATNDHPN
jgi:hypothetical protein